MRGLLELEPTSKLEFFIIYYNYEENPAEFIAIHAGSNGISSPLYWQGVRYTPFNIEGSDWEQSNDQNLPRPKIRVSNQGLVVSTLCRKYKNLNGAKVVRKRTLARFLDNKNFPNNQNPYGNENFNAGFADEKYFISRKMSEAKNEVEFELVTPLELENQKIPNRKVHSVRCGFVYRGYGCRYDGPPVADIDDNVLVESDIANYVTTDLILQAENEFVDTSKSSLHEKDFSTQRLIASAFSNVGLYALSDDGDSYPSLSDQGSSPKTIGTPFSDNSFWFNGSGAICLSTGFNPNTSSNQLTYASGDKMSRSVTFWCHPYSGADHNPSGWKVAVDFGDSNGGFGIFTKGSGESVIGYNAIIRASGGAGSFDSRIAVYPTESDPSIFNKWTHVAFTYNLTPETDEHAWAKLYLNGKLSASGQLWTKNGTGISLEARKTAVSTGANGIGAALNGWASDETTKVGLNVAAFAGWIEDFRSYNAEITATQINEIYQNQDISAISLNDLNDRGEYTKGQIYNRGDVVYVEGKRYKMFSRKTDSGFEGIKLKFLCLKNSIETDPRNDSTNWKRDACSHSMRGCSMRYGEVLPFGGYPGTHRYPFSARQNGY